MAIELKPYIDGSYDPFIKKTFEHPANRKLLDFHKLLYDIINQMLLNKYGPTGPNNEYYLIPIKDFDKLICAIKNIRYTGE